jgi:hypothetical protein
MKKGKANRAVAPLSEGGSGCSAIPLWYPADWLRGASSLMCLELFLI